MNVDDWLRFCNDFDVRLAVLSRDRADVLAKYTDRIAQGYTLFYSGKGYDEHEYRCIERIEVPRELEGRSAVANHALRMLDQRIVILLGDDFKQIVWLGEDRLQYLSNEAFLVMLTNLVVNALDVGATLFGINEVDIRKASPLAPFHTRSMIQGVCGVVGRGIWFDERQKLKEDYDFALEHIKRTRFVWKDLRYFCSKDMNVLAGGNMAFRTAERELQEVENLKRWWGEDMVRFTDGRGTKHLRIVV